MINSFSMIKLLNKGTRIGSAALFSYFYFELFTHNSENFKKAFSKCCFAFGNSSCEFLLKMGSKIRFSLVVKNKRIGELSEHLPQNQNPFVTLLAHIMPLLFDVYPQKTENHRFFDVFRGYRRRRVVRNGLIRKIPSL